MTKEIMMDNVVRANGLEAAATIYFFEVCEVEDDMLILEVAYEFAMRWPE